MSVAVLIQTCDHYDKYWPGFWHFMEMHWDFEIGVKIYFANEEKESGAPDWCQKIKTGKGTFTQNLKRSLSEIEEDDVFLMLEDFWPIAPMRREAFHSLYSKFREYNMDALQISNYTPLYELEGEYCASSCGRIVKLSPYSPWVFNFQARFWNRNKLAEILVEPEISESKVGSAITVEMACNELVRSKGGLEVGLFHYLWYPLSGVSYRGQFTEFGRELQNIVLLDAFVDDLFSRQFS